MPMRLVVDDVVNATTLHPVTSVGICSKTMPSGGRMAMKVPPSPDSKDLDLRFEEDRARR